MNMLTTAQYVEAGGCKCPHCQSTEIEGNGVEIDSGSASQTMYCTDCMWGWVDTYSLTGFINLTAEG